MSGGCGVSFSSGFLRQRLISTSPYVEVDLVQPLAHKIFGCKRTASSSMTLGVQYNTSQEEVKYC
eukprot:5783692-Amphidinium_carterae.1